MRGLSQPIRRLVVLALLGASTAACAQAAVPADGHTWDLGAFTMRAPVKMRLASGGVDSQAGVLTADGLRIDYDFGLYSDPLNPRDDALEYTSRSGRIDGLDARFVRYRLASAPDRPAQACAGVHVPGVRSSGMGPLALTVLVCAATADGLRDAPAMFDSIRFLGPVVR